MVNAALMWGAMALWCWPDPPCRLPVPMPADPGSAARPRGPWRTVLVALAATVAVLVVWPGAALPASVLGAAVGAGGWWESRRAELRPPRVRGAVALLCDLWAAGLDVGMPVGAALAAALDVSVAPGSVDPTVRRLIQVAGLLRVGADVERAWQPAAGDPWLEPIAAASRRAAQAGSDLAASVREQARSARRAETAADERRAQRAGVLMTAPLTLCFLPAFVCLGLAPVVIALVGTLDLGR